MKDDQFNASIAIHDPPVAQLFLQFYLFETWEKILQLNAFVNSREHRKSRRNWPVIKHFSDVLEHLTSQLDTKVVPLFLQLSDGQDFDFDRFVDSMVVVTRVLQALFKVHGHLNLLSGKVESPIAYDFVRKLKADTLGDLAQDSFWLPRVPSIALADSYNFIEYDLRNILSAELVELKLDSLSPAGQEVVLALPKAEVENPLMWAILAHETAHSMIESHSVTGEILAATPGYADAEADTQFQYRNWSVEICADLIALRLLGPSYLFSFATMNTLVEPPVLRTTDHPETANRIGIMEKIIDQRYPGWAVDPPGSNSEAFTSEDLVQFFFNISQYMLELRTTPRYVKSFPSTHLKAREPMLKPKPLLIDKLLDRHYVPEAQVLPSSRLCIVLGGLLSGQPVSSTLSEPIDEEGFQAKLRAAKTSEQLYDVLPPREQPLSLSTILICGWVLKLRYDFTDLRDELLEKRSLAETRAHYTEVLGRRNRLMQQSLRRAFMMQMYWDWTDNGEAKNGQ